MERQRGTIDTRNVVTAPNSGVLPFRIYGSSIFAGHRSYHDQCVDIRFCEIVGRVLNVIMENVIMEIRHLINLVESAGRDSVESAFPSHSVVLIHRAYTDKLVIRPETAHPEFDQCVFFTMGSPRMTVEDIARASYSQGEGDHLYVLVVPGSPNDLIVERGMLDADAAAEAEIARIWNMKSRRKWTDAMDADDLDIEVDADRLVQGHQTELEDSVEDGGWHIQRIRAQLARRLGYLAVADWDEQGRVLIVDFAGRNDELNRCWHYLGLASALIRA